MSDQSHARVNVRLRDFSRSLPMSLLRAREVVMQRFRSSLRRFKLTEQQWRVLRALTSVHEIEVTHLAHSTFLLTASLSRILKDLEQRGLIERRVDGHDNRRSLISISPAGIALIEAVAPYSETIYSEITDAVGQERLQQLQQLLKELTTAVSELPAVSLDDIGKEEAE
jgi:homoprotocatechuate degradation regulator HpaR